MKHAFQTIMVYDVFQIKFKLNRRTRGYIFVIILDVEVSTLQSSTPGHD